MITTERRDAVGIVRIDRHERRNALDIEHCDALRDGVLQLASAGVRTLVVTGDGSSFCAGADLDGVYGDGFRAALYGMLHTITSLPVPVIAAVNGPAIGLGCSISLLSDVVLISEKAYLCDPHVSVGLVAGDGGAAFWPLLTPILRSREFLYTGDRIPAATAVELGLATRTTPPDELMHEARHLAERFAAQSAAALRGTKRVVNLHLAQALSGAMRAGFEAEVITMQSPEHRERLLALGRNARQS